jgi:hypothetical protein
MANKSYLYNTTDLFWLSLGLALIASGFISFKKYENQISQSTFTKVATLDEVSNLVKIKNQNDLVWSKADSGQDLSQNSLIFAGDFSRAKVNFLNGQKVILMPGSIMRVFQDQKGKYKLEIKKGKAIKLTPKGEKSFIVPTQEPEVLAEINEEQVPQAPPALQLSFHPPANAVMTESSATVRFKWDILSEQANLERTDVTFEIQNPRGYKFSKSSDVKSGEQSLLVTQAGRYFWIAKVKDEIIEAGEFELIKLYPPFINGPKNTTIPQTGELDLQWSYGEEEKIRFEIETLQDGLSTFHELTSSEKTFPLKIKPDSPLKWRVRGIYEDIKGPWSTEANLWPETKIIAQEEVKIIPKIDPSEIERVFKNKIEVDKLPYEVGVKNLSPSLSSLVVFQGEKEIKSQGEDKFKFSVSKPGLYSFSWYQIEDRKLSLITETNLEISLTPLKDKINLPEDIVLEMKDSDNK